MKYYSTNHQVEPVNFEDAIFRGLPEDNGLFMPQNIPQLPTSFFHSLQTMSLPEIGFEVLKQFVDDEIPNADLNLIVEDTFSFDIPLSKIKDGVYSLELFHGPTLAFKDVGARFLARCLSYFTHKSEQELTVLVATSGDTGSAVAHGFFNVPGVHVVILYPQGKVSRFQEQQMTTLGGNIVALEVDGTFDDCQYMVKQSFLDVELRSQLNLTSANSINIARLLPQSIYYFYAWSRLSKKEQKKTIFSVPSGNYGNLSAGLIAQRIGLPVKRFLACSNINDTVPMYLWNAKFEPKPSIATKSNAMDVGNPSNFARMQDMFDGLYGAIIEKITGYAYTDIHTLDTIQKTFALTGYILDPHGAIGYLGLMDYYRNNVGTGVVLETAHPIKFKETVEEQICCEIPMPEHVSQTNLRKKSIPFSKNFEDLKSYLTP